MKPFRLAVITCHFNPLKKSSLRDNYLRFLRDMKTWDVDIFSAELVYGNEPFPTQNAFLQIRGKKRHLLWQKERLLNLLVEKLPPKYTHVAWIDADIIFLNPQWIHQAQVALNYFKIVHLFSEVLYVSAEGAIDYIGPSIGAQRNKAKYPFKELKRTPGATGGAWIGNRSIFPLYDRDITGGSDNFCLSGWQNKPIFGNCFRGMPHFRKNYDAWAKTAFKKVGAQIGLIDNQCLHLFHGERKNKQLFKRWDLLRKFHFNPDKDVEVDPQSGLLAFTDNANPQLIQGIRNYFEKRKDL